MSIEDGEDRTPYQVVINLEQQYSIWPADRDPPEGWTAVGKRGSKAECLAYVDEVWVDMRPASVRRHMEEMEAARRAEGPS